MEKSTYYNLLVGVNTCFHISNCPWRPCDAYTKSFHICEWALQTIVGFHMTSLKFKLKNYRSYRDFTFTIHWSSWKLIFIQIFASKGFLVRSAIEYAWISRDAAFIWRPGELSCRLKKKWFISGNFVIETVPLLEKELLYCLWVFVVSVPHVGAHPAEHQHGVSISLGKTALWISRIPNIPLTWILARVFVYVPPFISQILDFIYWTVLILILIYFEWRDTENQQ